jgi:hypothetical protein
MNYRALVVASASLLSAPAFAASAQAAVPNLATASSGLRQIIVDGNGMTYV